MILYSNLLQERGSEQSGWPVTNALQRRDFLRDPVEDVCRAVNRQTVSGYAVSGRVKNHILATGSAQLVGGIGQTAGGWLDQRNSMQ